MIEPVAYLVSQEPLSSVRWLSDVKPIGVDDKQITPLYTAEQLHPRVKMTQKQLNAFTKWNKRNKLLSPVELIWNVMGANEYPNEFGLELQEVSRDDKYLLSLANIWSEFDPNNPEELIEIVPDMKWFVRSKEPEYDLRDFIFLSGSNLDDLDYLVFDYARAFDTKEEAELWTNPLTKAVRLPVEKE